MFKIRETIAPVPSGFGRIQSFLQEEDTELHSMSSTEKNKNNSRGKFNDEQIKLLETMFETESRPEQRMKQHLANKVGLQPRQVAIWFQNKRARSKSKQIERDYSMLKISYDHLATKFETLKKENHSLLIQLQKLQELAENGGGKECEKKDNELENDQGLRFLAYEHELGMPSSNEKSEKLNYLEKEIDVLNVGNGSLTSVHNGCNFENLQSSSFLETSSCSSQWWEY